MTKGQNEPKSYIFNFSKIQLSNIFHVLDWKKMEITDRKYESKNSRSNSTYFAFN